MDYIIIKYINYIICHGSRRYHEFDDVRPEKPNKEADILYYYNL